MFHLIKFDKVFIKQYVPFGDNELKKRRDVLFNNHHKHNISLLPPDGLGSRGN